MVVVAAPVVKKHKVVAAHPTFAKMIIAAIKGLKERNGSSRQAILKFILANFKINATVAINRVRLALNAAIKSGLIVHTKGNGASGSFKLSEKAKAAPKKKVVKKTAVKPKKPSVKKVVKKTAVKSKKPSVKKVVKKTAVKPKNPSVKKVVKKTAVKPKKPSVKKVVKKTVKPKKPSVKKTPKKVVAKN